MNQTKPKATKKAGLTSMVIGGLLFGVGGFITYATLSSALENGGTYWIMWGPVLFGIYLFFKGLYQFATAPSQPVITGFTNQVNTRESYPQNNYSPPVYYPNSGTMNSVSAGQRYCGYCGAQLESNMVFCGKCGKKSL